MKIFSVLAERLGRSSLPVDIGEPVTVEQLLDSVVDQYPVIADYRPYLRVAVNLEYSSLDDEVTANDEIALLMPASGG